ncbi:MAG: aminotransferase class V-fold PLP-dependent enzyme [Holosporaceae bacterium]|jgi:cysteine desulfurase|nr:aminotransferase class V-fold PLP-dependent enzyme [Holosporaceae bacterium]
MKKIVCLFVLTACSSNVDNTDVVYLDYAASSHINEKALKEFKRVCRMDGNSSGINFHAKILKDIENQSAIVIASKINAQPEQILFTNSATISNNIAILGIAHKYPKCHLITSKIEHKSVLNVFKYLEELGHIVTYLNVDRYGNIDLKQLENSIKKNTRLISIQMLNSEIGTLQNMRSIGKIAKNRGILFHSDAAQAFCKYDIDVDSINIDFLTISGYKIGAPKGIAALYIRDRSCIRPILFGSGEEFFPGTRPTALIASFASAVKNFSFNRSRINRNFRAFVSELLKIDGVHINSTTPSHIVSISIEGVFLKDILERIREYSFAAGCSCLGQGQSNVMQAIDPEGKLPTCTVRISFSDSVKSANLVIFAQKLKNVVKQLRKEKSVSKGCESMNKKSQNDLNKEFEKIRKLF